MELADQQIQQTELSAVPSRLDYVNNKPYGGGQRNFRHQYSIASSDSITFHRDPFNKVELVNTLKGRELALFVLFFFACMILILAVFEIIMPVMFA